MIKHAHPDFPSDVFVLLAAVGATLSISELSGKLINVSMFEFLNLNMDKKIIVKIILPALDKSKYQLKTFKIMKRAQNTHAYVNSAFLFEFEDANMSLIKSSTLCFGGITAEFTRAFKTEKAIVGRKLFSNDTLSIACESLDKELSGTAMKWVQPEASPDYRKNLAIGLLYKAILKLAPIDSIKTPAVLSGGDTLYRPLSNGTQEFDTYEEEYPVTKAIPKYEGYIQTAGEAKYANDLPAIPGELFAVFVPATKVGSKIVNINPAQALAVAGVHGFFSAKDIPGKNNFTPLRFKMFNVEEEEIFCSETVLYYGQPLGMILADSVNLAEQASKLVEVEYQSTGKSKGQLRYVLQ